MTFELFFSSKLISFLANDEVVGALPNRYLNVSVNCCREIDFLIGKSWPHFHFFLKNVLEKLGFEPELSNYKVNADHEIQDSLSNVSFYTKAYRGSFCHCQIIF